ncbi:MlaC/ttg2D family ABC transporter substrate-binding protein [Microbulbifer thermotolerans]|uniref:ABC transporter substrate-binding protein n=1 Tax=Microbulbifer thermotolerans TaxID=252514 RepID=A0AB35HTS3_MICTH|nr:ABC transporter substrate-binding protein [Microbulbifer thermotolerans]MCX2780783.1 ABC transporter substrate-binding protein [Microbulbifer thermotolerans]MCX2800679.1 ABC transporter substrate-binding protein [Microbulbifer thermotolerans]MCX2806486.1 ABC transporter substrate-binding protein [Microbulbifer thermotolerans]
MNVLSLNGRVGFAVWLRAALCTLFVSAWASAASAAQNPYAMIEGVSENLLGVIRANAQYLESDPQRYYSAVDSVLNPVVDFNFIARGVMGRYAKQATADQRARFASTFRRDLVATFARGVAGFGSMDVKVVNPGSTPNGNRVNVLQEVRSKEGVTKVSYTLVRNRAGQWKLINVILNGVNLGKTFRSQFAQSMQTYGDIDKVISNWSAAEEVADQVG